MDKQVKTGVYTFNDVEETFDFYTNLRASDKISFVNSVVDTVVDVDNKRYNSVIRDIMFDYMIVNIFTNIVTDNIKTIDQIEDFLNETNIVEIVKANAEVGLIEELNKAVDLAIEYKTGIQFNPIADSITKLLNTLEQKVSEVDTKGMMEMAQVLSGVSGELTADKVLEAYAKSDLFKKVHE